MNVNTIKQVLLILPEAPRSLRDSGISIRYIPLIEGIYKDCTLDVLIISNEPCSPDGLLLLKKYCRNVNNVTHPNSGEISLFTKLIARIGFLLPWSLPRSWTAYGAATIKQRIIDITRDIRYTTTICVSGYTYPYLNIINTEKRVIDFIDSPSVLSWRNVIGSDRSYIVRIYESFKTFVWEAKIIRDTDASLYISSSDIKAIPSFLAPLDKRHVIRNGYCAEDYRQNVIESVTHPSIGFLGNMSYYPNVEAVLWLHDNVFGHIKKRFPGIRFYIIGRDPADSIKHLATTDGVFVTGGVESIWDYLNSVDIMVFPLMRGAGVKNKIIEAMYANRLVLTTDIGNEGIEAEKAKAMIICNTRDEYIEKITYYLNNPEMRNSVATKGRTFIEENFSWENIKLQFSKIIFS